jgi:hypothetical protein
MVMAGFHPLRNAAKLGVGSPLASSCLETYAASFEFADQFFSREPIYRCVLTTIKHLLFGGRPTTIIGRIRTIHINAIKASSRRTWPHICIEICEVIPPLTNHDTSSSIRFECMMCWSKTSLPHTAPSFPFWRPPHAMLGNASNMIWIDDMTRASTRLSPPAAHCGSNSDPSSSTSTLEFPAFRTVFVVVCEGYPPGAEFWPPPCWCAYLLSSLI